MQPRSDEVSSVLIRNTTTGIISIQLGNYRQHTNLLENLAYDNGLAHQDLSDSPGTKQWFSLMPRRQFLLLEHWHSPWRGIKTKWIKPFWASELLTCASSTHSNRIAYMGTTENRFVPQYTVDDEFVLSFHGSGLELHAFTPSRGESA